MKRHTEILFIILIVIPSALWCQVSKDSYSSSSLLSAGKWYKIAVVREGIYRLDFSKLKQLGLDYPSFPRIYANNAGQLSYMNDDPSPDDLREVALYKSTGNNGLENDGDYILFYARGTDRWNFDYSSKTYEYLHHNYSDTAFYFLTSAPAGGKTILTAEDPSAAPSYSSSGSDALFAYQKDEVNLIKSGREWFKQISSLHIDPGFSDILTTEGLKFKIRVAARASVPTLFRLYDGESLLKSIQADAVDLSDFTGTYFQITDSTGTITPSSPSPAYDIKFFSNGDQSAMGMLGYLQLQGRRSSRYRGVFDVFSDSRAIAPGQTTSFSIASTSPDPFIWDISDPYNISSISYSYNGSSLNFSTRTDSLKSFAVFSPASAIVPVIRKNQVPVQDLHASQAADMIILSHPFFLKYAAKIAGIHSAKQGLVSLVVTPEQIYNEFSGGVPDIAAIRNFVRMKYLHQKGTSHPLKYLLLLGDGSFENRTPPPDNPDFIPTYQSENSNVVVSSFTSDDFYGLLDDGEGEADGTVDIGIGRLPVSDTTQAGIAVAKIMRYVDPSNTGDWKNIICLSADDEDGNTHLNDAEGLAATINDVAPVFNINKIYLDAYKQITSATGQSYPDVNKAISNQVNAGCLIFNYTGHGNENELAAERVVRTEDINSWNNGARMPVFVTATCEFSRFDNAEQNVATRQWIGKPSGGELILFNRNGGGIALMSTTRVVYSAPNYVLNRNIFSSAFTRDEAGNPLCLGDIIRIAKNNSGSGPNKRNFTLLGDPALYLEYPYQGNIITDSINKVPVSENYDSLKSLSMVRVSGHVETTGGGLFDNFNGIISPIVFDKAVKEKTLANDGGPSATFYLRNNVLFSGNTRAENGRFDFTFIVPRDIDYNFGQGKISYYGSDDKSEMNGYFTNIIVGGFAGSTGKDNKGPEIRLFMNDTLFRNGGITDSNPILLAFLSDSSGINSTGYGIGHDITAYLDNDPADYIILNNNFENNFNNYTAGKVQYNLTGLSTGEHSITFKAWDNDNNSTEKSVHFRVVDGGKFTITSLVNYPDPFTENTSITLEHNRPGTGLKILVNIYRADGSMVRILRSDAITSGYSIPPIIWDGKEEGGRKSAAGMYIYTVTVTTTEGETARLSGRMIIL